MTLADQRPGRRPVGPAQLRGRGGAPSPRRGTFRDDRRRAHRHLLLSRGRVAVGAGCGDRVIALAPIGAVRPVYPDLGVAFDWTVLGFGSVVLIAVLSSVAILMALRESPHRVARRTAGTERSSMPAAHAAAAVGLPPAALTGIRSALGTGSGRDAAPVRSALLGAVLAVVVVVTSITFGASLNSLVSRPALYGWNWNYALLSGFSGAEDLPATETAALLNHDKAIAHWAGVYFGTVQLDGQAVPALAESPNASVSPPLLTGHGLKSPGEVVLGPSTLAMLRQHVGGTVLAGTGQGSPVRLRIVGTATLPTIGGSGKPDLQMGTGAVVSPSLFPPAALNAQESAVPGPNAVFITIRPGVRPPTALRSLDQVTRALDRPSDPDGPVGGVVSALRPAEIANYRTVGSTPLLLAGILAAGALGALGLTLVASVRRRQREFALLKALGYTQRQVVAAVAWQASVSAGVGTVFGLPLGIALGRWLWALFARGISAVPDPTVPVLWMIVVGLGALVFANIVATNSRAHRRSDAYSRAPAGGVSLLIKPFQPSDKTFEVRLLVVVHGHVAPVRAVQVASVRQTAGHFLHVSRVHRVVGSTDDQRRHVDAPEICEAGPLGKCGCRRDAQLARPLHLHVNGRVHMVQTAPRRVRPLAGRHPQHMVHVVVLHEQLHEPRVLVVTRGLERPDLRQRLLVNARRQHVAGVGVVGLDVHHHVRDNQAF